jgi:hypothetical protein
MATDPSSVRFDFVIDGSNVLLENKIGPAPSVRLFAALLHMLDQNGKAYKVWFDDSIHRHLAEKGADISSFKNLLGILRRKNCVDSASHADPRIQQDCQNFSAPVINGGDKNDSWRGFIPKIIRCRVQRSQSKGVTVFLAAAGSSKKLMTFDAAGAFQYVGMVFDALLDADRTASVGRNFAQLPRLKGTRPHGNLLVLALDASGSMDETDTYDGRPKHEHVNEILHDTLQRLGQSSIASSLWICVLAFSDQVLEHPPDESDAIFSSVGDWAGSTIDYLAGIERGYTNIRFALDRSADLIDGFRHSDVARALAMRWDAATVVLLTDGVHNTCVNGIFETASDIDDHVYATIRRSENVSFGFIGLGKSAKHDAMETWATRATDQQKEMAVQKKVPLVGGSLYVKVDAKSEHLGYIIRSFIDIASSRAK